MRKNGIDWIIIEMYIIFFYKIDNIIFILRKWHIKYKNIIIFYIDFIK